MKQLLKRPVERALGSAGAAWLTQRKLKGKRLILAYHGVTPHGGEIAGESDLFIAQGLFAEHLDVLSRMVDVVPLHQLDEEGTGRARVAITFDDAYRGAVCEGVHELAKRNLPATIFVAPGCLDDHTFWWDALSSNGALDPELRERALNTLSGADQLVKTWARRYGHKTQSVPPYARAASIEELHTASAMPGVTVGSHSWSHANLAGIQFADVLHELRSSRAWLTREFGAKCIPWLAYPYGLDSPDVHRAAEAAGFVAAVRAEGGWHVPHMVAPFARPRYTVPTNLSVPGFKARIIGTLTT